MATKRRDYHPPVLSDYNAPQGAIPEYILGGTGPQGFGSKSFYVAQIPCSVARAVILTSHYSRRIVNNSYIHLGIFKDGHFVGVMQFGYALCPALAGKVVGGTVQGEYLELNRMWLADDAPRNSESQALSYAIKYIKKVCPRVAWIQSFADERCGGLGVVYQAANFLYVGSHKCAFYTLDGETYHDMLLTAHKKGGQRGVFLRQNIDRAEKHIMRQFRYVFFIKRDWMKRLKMKVQPYPKRPSKIAL